MTDKPKQPQAPKPSEMQRCLDWSWRYIPANDTDVRRTWARFGWSPNLVRSVK